jgi:hypothetical protein
MSSGTTLIFLKRRIGGASVPLMRLADSTAPRAEGNRYSGAGNIMRPNDVALDGQIGGAAQ